MLPYRLRSDVDIYTVKSDFTFTFSTAMTHAALMKFTPSCMSLMPAALAISSSVTCEGEGSNGTERENVTHKISSVLCQADKLHLPHDTIKPHCALQQSNKNTTRKSAKSINQSTSARPAHTTHHTKARKKRPHSV